MEFEQITRAFDKGSVSISDGKLSVLYSRGSSGWISQEFSDTNPDDSPSDSKQVLLRLIRDSTEFLMIFAPWKMRFDFIIPSLEHIGNIQSCWVLPTRRDKTAEELEELSKEISRQHPEGGQRFREFIREGGYDIRDYDSMEAAFDEWNRITDAINKTPVSPEQLSGFDNLRKAALSLYSDLAMGSLETEAPESGDGCAYAEFQIEADADMVFRFSGNRKELLVNLIALSDLVNFEAGNNDKGSTTYVNLTFYA